MQLMIAADTIISVMSPCFWIPGPLGSRCFKKCRSFIYFIFYIKVSLLFKRRPIQFIQCKICLFYNYSQNILFLTRVKLCILKDHYNFFFLLCTPFSIILLKWCTIVNLWHHCKFTAYNWNRVEKQWQNYRFNATANWHKSTDLMQKKFLPNLLRRQVIVFL